jgi:DNA (cytosine-5)-methyltransferase 1
MCTIAGPKGELHFTRVVAFGLARFHDTIRSSATVRLGPLGHESLRLRPKMSAAKDKRFYQAKLRQALERGYFRTVDLFAGCGGMSLGFHRAGFHCVSAVELDPVARESHAKNFGRVAPEEGYACSADIIATSPAEAVTHLVGTKRKVELTADIIIGGPPCQAFSRLGRARLWELAGTKGAHAHDERATMYHHYLRYVADLKPIAFVMENVREIGKFVGRNVAEEIAATAEEMGYSVQYTLLNAVWFGTPQMRERMFIVGIRKELDAKIIFPDIAFTHTLPVGYSTSRAGEGKQQVLLPDDHYVDYHRAKDETHAAVTARDALIDLPPITYHLDGRAGKGNRRQVDSRVEYSSSANWFTQEMRMWPQFANDSDSVSGHVIRFTPRDYEIFRRMPPGAQYPEALAIAEQIFEERLRELESVRGKKMRLNSEEWNALRKATVPPYPGDKYPNKFRKMWADQPARTLPAHLGKDSYSHIHFDSEQARCISVREAARLQSFPDGFEFAGSMNHQLRQIGNAVPPLLAFNVANSLRASLVDAARRIAD